MCRACDGSNGCAASCVFDGASVSCSVLRTVAHCVLQRTAVCTAACCRTMAHHVDEAHTCVRASACAAMYRMSLVCDRTCSCLAYGVSAVEHHVGEARRTLGESATSHTVLMSILQEKNKTVQDEMTEFLVKSPLGVQVTVHACQCANAPTVAGSVTRQCITTAGARLRSCSAH